jgi:coenzyme F420 hydrogenase subunit delta
VKENLFIPACYRKEILILGCGNVLFGDDGFGPRVAEQLQNSGALPEEAEALDVGTGVREVLFTILLSEKRPRFIVIVDCTGWGAAPGSLRRLSLEDIPTPKRADFSLHQAPTSNLLRELRDQCGVAVVLLVVQPESVPHAVSPGLSPSVANAVQPACQIIVEIIRQQAPSQLVGTGQVNCLVEDTCDGNCQASPG